MSLKRWQKILVAAAAAILPILSCSQRSLVIVTVTAPNGVSGFQGTVNLVIHAGSDEQTRFDGLMFDGSQYQAGVYLPSDMTGNVPLRADLEQNGCIIATGNGTASGVQPGETIKATVPLDSVACEPVDGGATGTGGSLGSGGMMGSGGTTGVGGTTGTGGSTGAGGSTGQGGSMGKGGSGTGGSGSGNGGVNGTGGTMGNGGTTGKGGVTGTGGIPTTGNGGTTGAGGATGTGGVKGSGGIVGSGGNGSGGTGSGGLGSGGSGGSGTGSGGVGSGGTGGCTCPNSNEICTPATGACTCSQTDAEACMNIVCGSTTNICGQTVSCDNCPSGEVCVSGICRTLVTTGCGGSVATGGGLVTGSSDPAICPAQ